MTAETEEPVEADPALVTLLCSRDLHYRCPGWVATFPATGRRLVRVKCQCPVEHCGHGPHPRRQKH